MNSNQDKGTESLTAQIVMFLSNRPDDLDRFFGITGFEPGALRQHLQDPGFQAGLLDYLTANEPLLLAFAAEYNEDPAQLVRLASAEAPWE